MQGAGSQRGFGYTLQLAGNPSDLEDGSFDVCRASSLS